MSADLDPMYESVLMDGFPTSFDNVGPTSKADIFSMSESFIKPHSKEFKSEKKRNLECTNCHVTLKSSTRWYSIRSYS